MISSHPPDVIVLDSDSLLHARIHRGVKGPQIQLAKAYRLADDTFRASAVTPELANDIALAETLRRLRVETGRWDRVSVLLPDSWFRINLIELPSLSSDPKEAAQVVRWSLKRTLPLPPEELRVAYQVVSDTPGVVKLLVLSAVDKTLAAIEHVFEAAGFTVVLVEPVGLNIWNAITMREQTTAKDRIFVYARENDFTTAVFRGPQPLFIRSRNMSGDRTIQQEIRLSASYLRDTLRATSFEQCYLAANRVDLDIESALAAEFGTNVRTLQLRDMVDPASALLAGYEPELAACTGVFTA